MDTTTRVQILDEAVYISHGINTHGKGIYKKYFPLAKNKE